MKRLLAAALLVTGCTQFSPSGEVCQTVAPANCEAEGCAMAVTYREIVATPPRTDDHCWGEPYRLCIDDPDAAPGDAPCVFIYRPDGDSTVLRAESTTLPAGWLPCTGADDEPVGCACRTVGACGR